MVSKFEVAAGLIPVGPIGPIGPVSSLEVGLGSGLTFKLRFRFTVGVRVDVLLLRHPFSFPDEPPRNFAEILDA